MINTCTRYVYKSTRDTCTCHSQVVCNCGLDDFAALELVFLEFSKSSYLSASTVRVFLQAPHVGHVTIGLEDQNLATLWCICERARASAPASDDAVQDGLPFLTPSADDSSNPRAASKSGCLGNVCLCCCGVIHSYTTRKYGESHLSQGTVRFSALAPSLPCVGVCSLQDSGAGKRAIKFQFESVDLLLKRYVLGALFSPKRIEKAEGEDKGHVQLVPRIFRQDIHYRERLDR